MGRVGLADLAHDVKPGVEAQPVAAEARRHQNAGDSGFEEFTHRFRRKPTCLFCRSGTAANAGEQRLDTIEDLSLGGLAAGRGGV